MEKYLVFAALGLLTGAAARLLCPGRRPLHILSTLLVGIVGALVGGMISWTWWPALDREFHTGNLILSVLGAGLAIVLGAGIAYQRSLGGYRNASH